MAFCRGSIPPASSPNFPPNCGRRSWPHSLPQLDRYKTAQVELSSRGQFVQAPEPLPDPTAPAVGPRLGQVGPDLDLPLGVFRPAQQAADLPLRLLGAPLT